jgi:hypothetical protein
LTSILRTGRILTPIFAKLDRTWFVRLLGLRYLDCSYLQSIPSSIRQLWCMSRNTCHQKSKKRRYCEIACVVCNMQIRNLRKGLESPLERVGCASLRCAYPRIVCLLTRISERKQSNLLSPICCFKIRSD